VASYEKRTAASYETRSYQLSAISYLLSAICYQLSAISYLLSAISYLLSAICYQLTAVGLIVRTNYILGTLPPLDVNENRLKVADGYRLSAVGSKLRVPKRPAASYEKRPATSDETRS
jgi:hypothetical protein